MHLYAEQSAVHKDDRATTVLLFPLSKIGYFIVVIISKNSNLSSGAKNHKDTKITKDAQRTFGISSQPNFNNKGTKAQEPPKTPESSAHIIIISFVSSSCPLCLCGELFRCLQIAKALIR